MDQLKTYKASERGVALIFALLSILVLSVLAVAIMSTSQAQTWTALNYRMTTQSRYAAEAGIQKTMNWLSNNYTAPTTFTSYTMTTVPVTYNGNPVVLSAVSGVSTNYPDSTVASAFSSAAAGTVPGMSNATYATYATLLRMTPTSGVSWLPSTGGGVMQTWQITSVGSMSGVRTASVQVVETFERAGEPVFQYGLEALGTGCGAITLRAGDTTDSYDSTAGVYSSMNSSSTGGNIASNGNVDLSNTNTSGVSGAKAPVVGGNIAVPNPTVGACPGAGLTDSTTGNYGSLTSTSTMTVPLPFGCTAQPCYPASPAPITTNQNISTGCAGITGCTQNATAASKTESLIDGSTKTYVNDFTLTPGAYGNITINAADVVHLTAGTYTVNSLNFATDGQIVVDSGPVVFQLAGNCASGGCPTESVPAYAVGGTGSGHVTATEVIHGSGYAGMNACAPSGNKGVIANPNIYGSTTCGPSKSAFSGIPANMQIVYGGTDLIRLGGMPNAAVIYTPAGSYFTPGAPVGLYGSVIAKTFVDDSGSPWHYDTSAMSTVMQVGQFRPVGGFSWSKF